MCERVLEDGELSPLTRASEVECGMVGGYVVRYCDVGLRNGVLVIVDVVAVRRWRRKRRDSGLSQWCLPRGMDVDVPSCPVRGGATRGMAVTPCRRVT
jgi:hypothetical protein